MFQVLSGFESNWDEVEDLCGKWLTNGKKQGIFATLTRGGHYMGAMATEDPSEHQKVAIWSPLGRHGDRKSLKASGGSPW